MFRTIPAPPGAAVFGLPAAATWEPVNLEPWEVPTRECRAVVRRRAAAEPRGIERYRKLFVIHNRPVIGAASSVASPGTAEAALQRIL